MKAHPDDVIGPAVLAATPGGCLLIAVAAAIATFLARSSNPVGGARTERIS